MSDWGQHEEKQDEKSQVEAQRQAVGAWENTAGVPGTGVPGIPETERVGHKTIYGPKRPYNPPITP